MSDEQNTTPDEVEETEPTTVQLTIDDAIIGVDTTEEKPTDG